MALHLLWLTEVGLAAFQVAGGNLVQDGEFPAQDSGRAAFEAYLAQHANARFRLLADITEEGFVLESLPPVRGGERRQLLEHRLAQAFPETAWRLALPLGRAAEGRRDEQFLCLSVNPRPTLEPWLTSLQRASARLVSLHTPALLLPGLFSNADSGMADDQPWLLFQVGRAGIRQTCFIGNNIRFSRLNQPEAQFEADEVNEARESLCLRLALRSYQYLLNQRLLARAARLPCRVWADDFDLAILHNDVAGHDLEWSLWQAPAGKRQQICYRTADATLLNLLAHKPPKAQFAPPEERWVDRAGHLSATLRLCAMFLLLIGLALGAGLWQRGQGLNDQLAQSRHQASEVQRAMAQLDGEFPSLPMAAPVLHDLVHSRESWPRYRPSPGALWQVLSEELEVAPDLLVDKLEWQLGLGERRDAGAGPSASVGSGGPPQVPARSPILASAVVQGHLSDGFLSVNAGDVRAQMALVQSLADALARRPGLRVQVLRLPSEMEGRRIGDSEVERFVPARFSLQVMSGVVP